MQIKNTLTQETLIVGQANLTAGIVALKGLAKDWHRESQRVAASAAIHAHTTGDIRPISAVLAVMPQGAKTNSMRDYFAAFAPVKWSDTLKKFKFDGSKKVEGVLTGADNDLLSALLTRHWSTMRKPEKAESYKPFDAGAALLKLIKTAKAELEGEHKEQAVTKLETLTALETTYRTLFGVQAAA